MKIINTELEIMQNMLEITNPWLNSRNFTFVERHLVLDAAGCVAQEIGVDNRMS